VVQCAARGGLVAFARCVALHGMRCARAGCSCRRGELVAVAGADGAMLLTMFFFVRVFL